MGAIAVIDLDLPRPSASRVPRPSARRRTAALLVCGVLAVVAGGAAPTAPPAPPTVVAVGPSDLTFRQEGFLHVFETGYPTSGSATPERFLRTYRLPETRLVARVPLPVPGVVRDLRRVGDTVIVATDVGDRPLTLAVDADTGAARWSRSVHHHGESGTGRTVVLAGYDPDTGAGTWFGVDLRSGRERWRLPARPRDIVAVVGLGARARVLRVVADGRVEVRDPDSGAVLVAAELPTPPIAPRLPHAVWYTDDLLLLGGDGLTGYGLDRLDLRWHSDLDVAGGHWLTDCAGSLCLVDGRGGTQVVDPATGALRWRGGPWQVQAATGPYLVATAGDDPDDDTPLVVLDAASGRVQGTVGPWRPAGEPGADGRLPVTLVESPGQTMWYGELDPARPAVRVYGSGDAATGGCDAVSGALLCHRRDGSVAVWRLR